MRRQHVARLALCQLELGVSDVRVVDARQRAHPAMSAAAADDQATTSERERGEEEMQAVGAECNE